MYVYVYFSIISKDSIPNHAENDHKIKSQYSQETRWVGSRWNRNDDIYYSGKMITVFYFSVDFFLYCHWFEISSRELIGLCDDINIPSRVNRETLLD